jgi:hypothetical protein
MAAKTKLGRPKTVKDGQKLNVYVPKEIKQILFAMATEQRKSISAIVTDLVFETKRNPSLFLSRVRVIPHGAEAKSLIVSVLFFCAAWGKHLIDAGGNF